MLKVESGCFSYNKCKNILNSINFEVEEGDVISILGQNGIGKTTFIKCMMNILKWKSGRTLLKGQDIKEMKHKDVFKEIAYVPQAKNTVFSYSVIEMVVMGRNAHLSSFGTPSQDDYDIALDCLEAVGMLEIESELCSHLSGGQLQMVLIARALASQPKILILDEPESNLDFKNQVMVLDIIEKLSKEKNVSIIFNTHFPAHALKVSNKTLLLVDNNINLFGQTKDIVTRDNMKKAFNVNVHIEKIEINKEDFYTVIPY